VQRNNNLKKQCGSIRLTSEKGFAILEELCGYKRCKREYKNNKRVWANVS
jgi:hypothetical protein